MMVWWNSILISEYSSRCARTAPLSKVANICRSEAISSSLAFSVINRAAMLSSAAQAVINSMISRLGLAHHIDAAPGHRAHEPFALQLRHRLAHRRTADAEVLRQAALVEPDFFGLPYTSMPTITDLSAA